ncbi:hypothetical protein DOTSEDRAFT_67890 [Dothistroma septosporum NZE10]|uniref:Uncharacterized protein n=1 Tax=Dothistroma septosporum (strain NZE10 / CBS 128990) TaxID=675120 RepID=N1PZY5_DOTSN|nr:hypothetical protein DOTSEDRAFT_67890 [Dothistroma septosporum NZE10]
MDADNNIRHSVYGSKASPNERTSFQVLKREIDIQLDVIMRRNRKVVSSSTVADDRQVRQMESHQSARSGWHLQPSRRALRRSVLPTTPSAVPPPALTEAMTQIPDDNYCSAPLIPPTDYQTWKHTRVIQQ